jgi:hypothetical protein
MVSSVDMVWIAATGEVFEGDEQKLFLTMVDYLNNRGPNDPAYPSVAFHSGGGSPDGGMAIGRMIRAFELPTDIPVDAVCASACTLAFLGGTRRTVTGIFAIHSASFALTPEQIAQDGPAELRKFLDGVQQLSSDLLAYEREMVGTTYTYEAAFRVGSANIPMVPDHFLRDWHVITYAMRAEQQFVESTGSLSRCSDSKWVGESGPPRLALCYNLDIGRDAMATDAALAELASRPLGETVNAEQASFDDYWNDRCVKASDLTGDYVTEVENCVAAAFSARRSQLEGLVTYYAVGESEVGANWRQ